MTNTAVALDKLYRVSMLVDGFHGYDGVYFRLFTTQHGEGDISRHGVPYSEICDPADQYSRGLADELLTEAEKDELVAWASEFDNFHDIEVTEQRLPIRADAPLWPNPVYGGGQDGYMFHLQEGYSLSFPVQGDYDLRGHWEGSESV